MRPWDSWSEYSALSCRDFIELLYDFVQGSFIIYIKEWSMNLKYCSLVWSKKYTNVFCVIYSCGVYLTLFWTFKLQYIVDKTFGSEMYMTQEYTCLQT